MYKNKKIGVVVPAYNEENFIGIVIEKIPAYIDLICVVDDFSTDRTNEVANKAAEIDPTKIKIIKHEKNSGVGKAIITGYKLCIGNDVDIAVVMAGDNQMDPIQLPKLLDPIVNDKADYTIGDRLTNLAHQKGMSLWRRMGNWILKWLTRIVAWNNNITDPQNGFTAITRKALLNLDLNNVYPRYGYCNDILVSLSLAKTRILQVPMPAVYGFEKSKIKYWHYIPTLSWLLLRKFLWRISVSLKRKKTC
jgi:glycosyltransferase involved in cell wall biosynthesis